MLKYDEPGLVSPMYVVFEIDQSKVNKEYFEYLMKACPEAVSFTDHMDGGIFSCHEHITKPDTGIYLRLCSRYGLDPSECLFIDDRPVNTAGAVRSGMNAFLFESYEKNYHEIMEIISGKRKTLMQ